MFLKDRHRLPTLKIVWNGRAGMIDAGLRIAVIDEDDPFRLRHSQRMQQDVIDDGEEGDVRANAQRQRQDRRDGEAWRATKAAQRVANVLKDATHGRDLSQRWID